jgi:AcrR family transcriptional regulator
MRSPSRSRPRERLSPDAIAVAALGLIDRDGLETLSMRRLGEALGVEAMALYHHFPSRAALLDSISERLIGEIEMPDPSGDVVAWLGEVVRCYVALADRHPEAFPLLATRRFNTVAAFGFVECVVGTLIAAGASPELAAEIFRGLGAFANGAALAGIAVRQSAVRPAALDATSLPNVARVAPWLGPRHVEQLFTSGLGMFLEGVALRLERGRIASGPRRKGGKKADKTRGTRR